MSDAVQDVVTPTGAGKPTETVKTAEARERRHIDWIAWIGAAAAIAAAAYTGWNAHVASEENIVAEQQQLLTLTVNIAQQFANEHQTVSQAEGQLTGTARSSAQSSAQVGITNQLGADGEAAAVLVGDLHGNGVAGVEYVQAAKALVVAGDISEALTFYRDALIAPPRAPDTLANSLRGQGSVYYSLDRPTLGHQYMMRAVQVYAGHPELTSTDIENSVAQSYLYDAEYQLGLKNCSIAENDLRAALPELTRLGASGEEAPVTELVGVDTPALKNIC
jgi:hypothetical protein